MKNNHSTSPSMVSPEVDTSSYHSPSSSLTDSPSFRTTTSEGEIREKKFGTKALRYACRIREHVKMGPKLSETVKGKLSLGAKIVKQGGRENIFKHIFGVVDGEKLLKASQCYLSTTAGPIAGILFVSTEKVAFCSERSITLPISSSAKRVAKTPYKVIIPLNMITRAGENENKDKPEEKYITIVTEDEFEFWFMGFVRFEKALLHLQQAISMERQGYNLFVKTEEKQSVDH
ncbi:hypothetical protein Leryth_006512 [Lithospermum erythrorhizon]|nr:hypothetical protein Leryth_006512 [Lithospermum erythrorhizon]